MSTHSLAVARACLHAYVTKDRAVIQARHVADA